MANEEHLKILKQGVRAWNRWREEDLNVKPDLRGADLRKVDLSRINLSKANLIAADLSGADLNAANLIEARLLGAILNRATLNGAELFGTDLSYSNLNDTDFSGARFGATEFGDVDLSAAKGLETAQHAFRSVIGVDTLYLSRGKIPEVFLRGCGVPDTMIAYIGTLVDQPTQYYSCFISYSSQDRECAERLYTDLQGQGVRCWFAPEDMKTGDKILAVCRRGSLAPCGRRARGPMLQALSDRLLDRIDQEIRIFDKLLLIFSEHSIDSDWVETEVRAALEKENRTKRTVLFPIRLDGAVMETGQAWAAKVRHERHITDFRGWKNRDTYQKQFARLLRDLQAVDAQEAVAVEPVPSPRPKSRPTESYRATLRQNLVAAFNDSELRDLCFDMNVDYESLTGENKADKARELVAFCERRQIVPDLVARCQELRPQVSWEGEYE